LACIYDIILKYNYIVILVPDDKITIFLRYFSFSNWLRTNGSEVIAIFWSFGVNL